MDKTVSLTAQDLATLLMINCGLEELNTNSGIADEELLDELNWCNNKLTKILNRADI